MADVEALYKSYGILADAGEKAGEHSAEYEAIIEGTKGDNNAKRLAADFIAKFFALFPDMAERAIEAELDLCEDEDHMVRIAAMKALPMLCRDGCDNSPIGDVLAQLLQTESASELKVVRAAMQSLLKKDTRSALAGLFMQINSGEVLARDRAVSYLSTSVVELLPEVVHPHADLEAYILEEGKAALASLTGNDFKAILQLLRKLKCLSHFAGTQKLMALLTDCSGIVGEEAPVDGEALSRALMCAYEMASVCKRGAAPKVFVEFIVNTALANFAELEEDTQLLAAKALAALSLPLTMKPEDLLVLCEPTLATLMDILPEAPQLDESGSGPTIPAINYCIVESLLYSFHQLAKKCPEFMHSDDAAAGRLRLLKIRLQFLGLCCQSAQRELKSSKDEKAAVTIKAIQNISILIKSFLKVPPSYQASITLSFAKPAAPAPVTAPAAATQESPAAQKRPASTASDNSAKRSITGKELREQFAAQQGSQPANRGGGQWRGRGRARGWRGQNSGQRY